MTSKDYIIGVLYNLEEILDNAKETKNKDLEIDCKMQKEAYNQVLKDLEDYEELKELMGTPIQDIMKKLKVLEILKEYLTPHIIEELCIEEKEVKEWLGNE